MTITAYAWGAVCNELGQHTRLTLAGHSTDCCLKGVSILNFMSRISAGGVQRCTQGIVDGILEDDLRRLMVRSLTSEVIRNRYNISEKQRRPGLEVSPLRMGF